MRWCVCVCVVSCAWTVFGSFALDSGTALQAHKRMGVRVIA